MLDDLRRVATGLGVIASLTVSFACSSTSGGTTDACSTACAHSASCPNATSVQTCTAECHGLHLSQQCTDAITSAPCSELAKGLDQSSVTPACFASCSPDEQHCIAGDRMQICKSSVELTADCSWACSTAGKAYVGVCGSSYQGQTSPNGGDVCWCK